MTDPGHTISSVASASSASPTFNTVASIISETCDIPRETIKPESHAINDLGIDSLDFLDIAFAIDKAFGIKMPLEQWTQEVNDGKATTDQYFQLNNLCTRIDELVAAKRLARLHADRIFSADRPNSRAQSRRSDDPRRGARTYRIHYL